MVLHQASMCFAMDDLRPFLKHVTEAFEAGFGADEVERVWRAAVELGVEEEAQLGFLN